MSCNVFFLSFAAAAQIPVYRLRRKAAEKTNRLRLVFSIVRHKKLIYVCAFFERVVILITDKYSFLYRAEWCIRICLLCPRIHFLPESFVPPVGRERIYSVAAGGIDEGFFECSVHGPRLNSPAIPSSYSAVFLSGYIPIHLSSRYMTTPSGLPGQANQAKRTHFLPSAVIRMS